MLNFIIEVMPIWALLTNPVDGDVNFDLKLIPIFLCRLQEANPY